MARASLAPESQQTLENETKRETDDARLRLCDYRKFSGDESFLKDPNAYNDAKNAATLEVIDEPVSVAADKAEDKSRL